MRRKAAVFWHATLSVAAGLLYFCFVLPRWWELMGNTTHTLGTAVRIVAGVVIALAALPVVFTWLRDRKPEYGTPQLALTLQTCSVVAHVLAGVLIVGAAISEIWLNLDTVGQWLFGVYGAAAAIAVLGILGFYLSFVAELPPPPPKPIKPKKDKQQRRRRKTGAKTDTETEEGEADEDAAADGDDTETAEMPDQDVGVPPAGGGEPAKVTAAEEPDAESTAEETESTADEAPALEDTVDAETPQGGLRNRRPSGKSSTGHRRRRTRRGGVAVED
jgi:hypothetical protein